MLVTDSQCDPLEPLKLTRACRLLERSQQTLPEKELAALDREAMARQAARIRVTGHSRQAGKERDTQTVEDLFLEDAIRVKDVGTQTAKVERLEIRDLGVLLHG